MLIIFFRSINGFNSRAHEGRDGVRRSVVKLIGRFNSRAHEGRDLDGHGRLVVGRRVSIHAPTRGATLQRCEDVRHDWFQFTRPRGARRTRSHRGGDGMSFNSRAHEGRDGNIKSVLARLEFQFTRPRGARPAARATPARHNVSIHAPTRGATAFGTVFINPSMSFNSRAHEGRDLCKDDETRQARVSIHAPTRGATRDSFACDIVLRVSIHAPTRGATSLRIQRKEPSKVSIHAPTRGATRPRRSSARWGWSFNSRAHEGRDPRAPAQLKKGKSFNSRAHEGRDPN